MFPWKKFTAFLSSIFLQPWSERISRDKYTGNKNRDRKFVVEHAFAWTYSHMEDIIL